MTAIIIAPDGTATLRPSLAAARACLRPAKIAPGAVTDAGYLAWRAQMDASCPCRSLAVAAIGAALLATRAADEGRM